MRVLRLVTMIVLTLAAAGSIPAASKKSNAGTDDDNPMGNIGLESVRLGGESLEEFREITHGVEGLSTIPSVHRLNNWENTLAQFGDRNVLTATEKQIVANLRNVRAFLERSRIRGPAEITAAVIEAYLAELRTLGRSPKTILNVKSSLSRFCRFLKKRGEMTHNPCGDVECTRPEIVPPPVIEPGRLPELLSAARELGLWEIVLLAIATGLRAAELSRLAWADVDAVGRTLMVRRAKGKAPRIVPLCQAATAALAAQRQKTGHLLHVFPARKTYRGGWKYVDRPASYRSMLRALQPLRARFSEFHQLAAGSVGNGWHLFRHQFATEAIDHDVSETKLAEWMGHTDTRLTRRYARMRRRYDPAIEAVLRDVAV